MAIKCGHCGSAHNTVAQVKACSTTPNVPAALRRDAEEYDAVAAMDARLAAREPRGWSRADREMAQAERAADLAEARRATAAKVAKWDAEDAENARVQRLADERDFKARMAEMEPSELIARVETLLAERDVEPRYASAVRDMLKRGTATRFGLETTIARLEHDYRPVVAARPTSGAPVGSRKLVEREGLYRHNGVLYQVIRTKDGKRLYANSVHFNGEGQRPTLTYERGAIYDLTDAELLPVEEAQEITRKTGWCVFGHFLTNPVSIKRGMGPKCYERYPHLARTHTEEAA